MPEKCILEAFGTGVPNGILTVKSETSSPSNNSFFTDPAVYIPDSGLVDPQVILDYPGTIQLNQNQQIIRLIKNEPVTIEWPKYFKLKFSVKINQLASGWRNILHGLC